MGRECRRCAFPGSNDDLFVGRVCHVPCGKEACYIRASTLVCHDLTICIFFDIRRNALIIRQAARLNEDPLHRELSCHTVSAILHNQPRDFLLAFHFFRCIPQKDLYIGKPLKTTCNDLRSTDAASDHEVDLVRQT